MPRIFATCDIGSAALQRLRDKGWELEVYPHIEPPPKALIVEKVRAGVDALITTLRDTIDAEVLEAGAAHGLRIVAHNAVGIDTIDRAAANRLKIPFSNTAGVLTEATAEFAFFMMGCVARKTWPSEQVVRGLKWSTWHPYHPWLGAEVVGRTVAVLGTGRIGQSFIKKAIGFDMDVLCFAPRHPDLDFLRRVRSVVRCRFDEGLTKRLQTIDYVTLEEALHRADFVTLHVALAKEGPFPTFHLMNEARLRLMKKSAYLINTARGAVVDETALVRALREDWIAGAALDVFEQEPLPPDSPLRDPELSLKVRLFHHFASGAEATRLSADPEVGMAGRTVQAVIDVLEGAYNADPRQMPYVVNKEAF